MNVQFLLKKKNTKKYSFNSPHYKNLLLFYILFPYLKVLHVLYMNIVR